MSSIKILENLLFSYYNPEKEWYENLKRIQTKGIKLTFSDKIKINSLHLISLIQFFHQEYSITNQDILKPILLNDCPIVFRDDKFNIKINFDNNESINLNNIRLYFWHSNSLSHINFTNKYITNIEIRLIEESDLRTNWEIDNFNNEIVQVSKITHPKLIYANLKAINDPDILKERLNLWGLNSNDLKLISNVVNDLGIKNILQLKKIIEAMTESWSNEELITLAEKFVADKDKYFKEAFFEYEQGLTIDQKKYDQYFDYIIQT